MGRMKDLALQGEQSPSRSSRPQFWERQPRTSGPQVTMPIDRDVRHLQNSFPTPRTVTKRAAAFLHARMSKLGIPADQHYDVARLWSIALGTMSSSEPMLFSLTELTTRQYSHLMTYAGQELIERGLYA